MKKVLLIAQSESKALDAVKLFPNLNVKTVYPGTKNLPRHFHAVVIFHGEVSDLNLMKDIIQRYASAPIKTYIGKTAFP